MSSSPFLSRRQHTLEDDRAYLRDLYASSARGGPGRALGASIDRTDLAA